MSESLIKSNLERTVPKQWEFKWFSPTLKKSGFYKSGVQNLNFC